jgi:uncharacterized OB-fold protein
VRAQWAAELDPAAVVAADGMVDLDAAEARCPACGALFATSAARCPGCGLRFG